MVLLDLVLPEVQLVPSVQMVLVDHVILLHLFHLEIQCHLLLRLNQESHDGLWDLVDQACQVDLVFQVGLTDPLVRILHHVLHRHLFQVDRVGLLVHPDLGSLMVLDCQILPSGPEILVVLAVLPCQEDL